MGSSHTEIEEPFLDISAAFSTGPFAFTAGLGGERGRSSGRGRSRSRRGWPRVDDLERGGDRPLGSGRASRGDVRLAMLYLLGERPMHGYQIMGEIKERSGGAWRPSPGSVYPTLQQLEDEDLVASDQQEGRRVFRLTATGEAYLADLPEGAPWQQARKAADVTVDLREALATLIDAVAQVARAGTTDQHQRTEQILTDTRRQLYRLLADDAPGS